MALVQQEPRDPTPKEQLAALVWERFKRDKRYPYQRLAFKLWNEGHTNTGQIIEALDSLAKAKGVRNPYAYVHSSGLLGSALSRDAEARAHEESRIGLTHPIHIADILRRITGGGQGA